MTPDTTDEVLRQLNALADKVQAAREKLGAIEREYREKKAIAQADYDNISREIKELSRSIQKNP